MKHKKLFALVLAAALLLTACGGPAQAETEPPMVEYSHPVGITITLPQGFAQIETEGILAGFSNSAEAINVVFEEMLFEEIISYGYDPAAISLEDYARVTADRLGIEEQPQTDAHGNVYLRHESDSGDHAMTFFEYMHRGEAAFWIATFMCLTEDAETLAPEFARWNTTVQLPKEGVTTFTPPTAPREALEDQEVEKLLRTVNQCMQIDWLGRSFESAALTDGELLELSLWLSGGAYSGFASTPGDQLRRFYTGKYLGREDFALADLFCVCGEQVGKYSADRDEMVWISGHDHRDHYCQAVNYVQDAWRQDDGYYVTMYKLFPDTEEHASGSVGFYPTIADAQAQTNVLFHAAGTEELNEHTAALDPATLPLYTLRFAKQDNGDYVLLSYTIG